MIKKIFFILILLLIPTIMAYDSQINIETKPYHRILVSIYKAGVNPPERIISFSPYRDTKASGKLSFSLSTNEKKVDIKVELKKEDGTPVITRNFENVETDKPIYIVLFPPDNITIKNFVEEPVVNVSSTSNIEANQSSVNVSTNQTPSSENSTENEKSKSVNISEILKPFEKISKFLFYLIIIIVIGLFFIFSTYFIVKRILRESYPNIKINDKVSHEIAKLREINRKLKIIQREIEKILQEDAKN